MTRGLLGMDWNSARLACTAEATSHPRGRLQTPCPARPPGAGVALRSSPQTMHRRPALLPPGPQLREL